MEETIKRIEQLIVTFKLDHLNPNICAQFYFYSAYVYSLNEEGEQGVLYLKKFVVLTGRLLDMESNYWMGILTLTSWKNFLNKQILGQKRLEIKN